MHENFKRIIANLQLLKDDLAGIEADKSKDLKNGEIYLAFNKVTSYLKDKRTFEPIGKSGYKQSNFPFVFDDDFATWKITNFEEKGVQLLGIKSEHENGEYEIRELFLLEDGKFAIAELKGNKHAWERVLTQRGILPWEHFDLEVIFENVNMILSHKLEVAERKVEEGKREIESANRLYEDLRKMLRGGE